MARLVRDLERRADEAERMQATAPVAAVLNSVIAELRTLNGGAADPHDGAAAAPGGERLLTAAQVAERLSMSVKSVYRSAGRWPFTRRVGRLLRFSASGLEKWLARR